MQVSDNEPEFQEWLGNRKYNMAAGKIAPIVKEYSNDPYWSTIPCYSDAFSVYCDSLLSGELQFHRSRDGEAYYNRLGNFIEPFIYQEFLKILGIEKAVESCEVVCNVHQLLEEERIACTPDYAIYGLDENELRTLDDINNLATSSFTFVRDPNFNPMVGDSFLLECKSKSLRQLAKDYLPNEGGELLPPPATILQLQTQMLVTGIKSGAVGTIVFTDGGVRFHFYFMNACPVIANTIRHSVRNYHKALWRNQIPIPTAERSQNLDDIPFEELGDPFSPCREISFNIEDLNTRSRADLIRLLATYQKGLRAVDSFDKELIQSHGNALKAARLAKERLDSYLQVICESTDSYVVNVTEGNLTYRIESIKEPDWIGKRQRMTNAGDIIKRGERRLSVQVVSSSSSN